MFLICLIGPRRDRLIRNYFGRTGRFFSVAILALPLGLIPFSFGRLGIFLVRDAGLMLSHILATRFATVALATEAAAAEIKLAVATAADQGDEGTLGCHRVDTRAFTRPGPLFMAHDLGH
jgi:hypothetical protein